MAAQVPDIILIGGEKRQLYTNPLEQYWAKFNRKKPTFLPENSCLRGYVATWEIRDRQLLLREIDGNVMGRSFVFWKKLIRFSLDRLFSKARGRAVKASWFSGKLRVPGGSMTEYSHVGYDSRFEKETLINVEQGNVVKSVTVDYNRRELVVEKN